MACFPAKMERYPAGKGVLCEGDAAALHFDIS